MNSSTPHQHVVAEDVVQNREKSLVTTREGVLYNALCVRKWVQFPSHYSEECRNLAAGMAFEGASAYSGDEHTAGQTLDATLKRTEPH
jgi:hypothetical protein